MFWRGNLLAALWLVLALVIASPATVLSDSGSHVGVQAPAMSMDRAALAAHGTDAVGATPCHQPSGHHAGPSDATDLGASGVDHHGPGHDAGGCCAAAACGTACASACSGIGASATLSSSLVFGSRMNAGLVPRAHGDTLRPGTMEAPFRPPIAASIRSAG